jgi:GNAT superfamily N-acetyltransferase
MTPPNIQDRAFAGTTDIERITQFLLETYRLYDGLHNWDPRRWLGAVYHRNDADMAKVMREMPDNVHIWQDGAGHIVGVVIPEYEGDATLQVHPDYTALEDVILAWAEDHLAVAKDDGKHHIYTWATSDDEARHAVLEARGYARTGAFETMRRRDMSQPVPDVALPEGYVARAMRVDEHDQQKMAELLNKAFGRTIHSAEEYRNFQQMPYYRAQFDRVIEAPDGTLVATAGFTVHEAESFALVEPVATHPDHQGIGLGTAVINDGLREVHEVGLARAYIGAWHANPTANYLYQKLGFTDGIVSKQWGKVVG